MEHKLKMELDIGVVYSSNRLLAPPGLEFNKLPPPPPPGLEFNKLLPPPPPPLPSAPSVCHQTVTELHDFLSWKDPKLAHWAPKLLEMFSVHQVALAVRDWYGMTPPGWRTTHLFTTATPAIVSIKPELSRADMVINELLETEQHLVNKLWATEREFLDPMFKIYGSGTPKQIKQLGLTQQETNKIFEKLVHIRQFSEELLQQLYCVNLVRTQPLTREGRALVVGLAFAEMAPKLHVFAPATMCYKDSLDILSEAKKRLSGAPNSTTITYASLWERATKDGPLQGQQMNAVLVTPMQRIPRYKMLLEALAKDCKQVEVLNAVKHALDMVSNAADQINDAVGKHEKLGKMFGNGNALNQAISSSNSKRLSREDTKLVVNAYSSKVAGMI